MNPNLKTGALFAAGLLVPLVLVWMWLAKAGEELAAATAEAANVPIASAAEDEYCSVHLKQVLRRVAGACGLIEGGGRGCKPTDAKNVAALSGDDFNTLFKPMARRAALIQFDAEVTDLDPSGAQLVEEIWGQQGGASFFFVVARASPDGSKAYNQELSQKRAESVLTHLETRFEDPELRKEVGLLWLGEEYAQLGDDFCAWKRSGAAECDQKTLNRSALVTWIDCAI